jgi:hypothetical protein
MAKKLVLPGLRPMEAVDSQSPAQRLELGLALSAAGLLSAAQKVLQALVDHAECREAARRELLIIDYTQRSGLLEEIAPLCTEHRAQEKLLDSLRLEPTPDTRWLAVDALVWKKGGHGRTLFFFTGTARRNLPRMAMLQRSFKGLGCNIVYVRDHQKLWHMAGLSGMPSKNPHDMSRELLALHTVLGGGDVLTAGSSVGAYAALRFGLHLKAKGVLGFSAFTDIALTPQQLVDYPALQGLYDHDPTLAEDLLPLYAQAAQAAQAPHVELCYGAAHERDARHATHLSGLPRVRLHPVADLAEHDTVKYFQGAGQLPALMSQFVQSACSSVQV